jgi:hypothetical protein
MYIIDIFLNHAVIIRSLKDINILIKKTYVQMFILWSRKS